MARAAEEPVLTLDVVALHLARPMLTRSLQENEPAPRVSGEDQMPMGAKLVGNVSNQIQAGLQNGTLNQAQADRLTGDLNAVTQAFQSKDPNQIKQAMGALRKEAEQDNIKIPHRHHGGMKKLREAAENGDPQAEEMLKQMEQMRMAQNGGAGGVGSQMQGGIASQLQGGNPYLNMKDSFLG